MPMNGNADHPVFKRFSRQQLIVRRRNIGFQTLVFDSSAPRSPRCKHCGRVFSSAVWKEFLCHVCGLWVCQPCSSVIEREREVSRVQFIRSCYDCLSMVNKWSDPELLTQFALSPWVVQSSKSQIALNLSDALRNRKDARHSVLLLLKHLGMPVDPSNAALDAISETDWVAATSQELHAPHGDSLLESSGRLDEIAPTAAETVQHLVQQCFEVVIPELRIDECRFAESDGTRSYPILYDNNDEAPTAPVVDSEQAREQCIDRYRLLDRAHNAHEVQLICDLAASELDASTAFISVVRGDTQTPIASRPGCACSPTERSQTFCAFALTSELPFLVRDAVLDIRFRNFEVVRGAMNLQFYCGFPIRADDGTTVASLCVIDSKPRKYVTTMQYSIMKKLTEIIATLWTESHLVAQI